MSTLIYGLLGGSALLMVWQDVRTQTISWPGLGLFIAASLSKQGQELEWEGFWAACAIALVFASCQGLFYLLKREVAMGWGDLVLSPFCGLWLYFHEIPSFFLSVGVIGLLISLWWFYQWKMRTFPMAPAILAGLAIVFLMRCFSKMNGI